MLLEEFGQRRMVFDVQLGKRKVRVLPQQVQPMVLQRDIIIVVEVIDSHNLIAPLEQLQADSGRDKTRTAGDEKRCQFLPRFS